MKLSAITWTATLTGLMLFSQSCAIVSSKTADRKPSALMGRPMATVAMTGSTKVYGFGVGKTKFFTNDLEELYPDGIIDFIHSPDPMVRQVMDKIPFNAKFRVVIVNGTRSKKTVLQINDQFEAAPNYGPRSDKSVFSFSPRKKRGAIRLESLKLHILKDAFAANEFASSSVKCVSKNVPGPNGEYRNGALTLQLVDAEKTSQLLAEFTIHKENPQAHCQ